METEITFEPSGRDGLVAVGTYLGDAAKRLGIEIDCEEEGENSGIERCVVKVISGAELLSPLTKLESEYLSEDLRNQGNRLADQAKIEKEGAISVMVKEKKSAEPAAEEKKAKEERKEFEELPLEKKVAKLLEMEMITLGETVSFIFNSPYAIAGKVMDVMAEFGLKMDKDKKDSKRPDEHKQPEPANDEKKPKTHAETSSHPAGETA